MPSSEMERYIRKIDVTQLARVRRANENEEQIHSSFITSGWFSYNDPMHKYTKHYISNKNNNTKNQSNSSTLPIVPKKENCTKSQKFHFLYHKTLSDQSGNRYRNTRVVHTKRDGESNQSEVELLQVPTHEEFLHRDQMREKNGQNGNGRNTNREQILEWYGKSFGAALTASLNFDVKKKEKNQKSGGCSHPQEANGMATSHEGSNVEIEQPPGPIATSSQLPILTDKTWYDEERKKESLILAWELSMHVLGAYKQIPKTPKTPSVENPFLPKKNDKQVCTSLIPNESKRRGHGRTSWRRRTGTLVAVASLRRK